MDKRCNVCGDIKPLDDFYRNGGGRPGHHACCKACDKARQEALREQYRCEYEERGGPLATEKKCGVCKTIKPAAEFYPNRATRSGLSGYCIKCTIVRSGTQVRNPRTVRNGHLKRTYGITMDEFEQMVEAQQGQCVVCERVVDRLVVDHDHETGATRELLCGTCNSGLGLFGENPEMLRRAAEYLEHHRSQRSVLEEL